ncbi:transposase IS200-family protein [Neobacillus massiliamazoniensis]|uniref:Transposase IS200-family protein n=2 Tax=Neobacillus massiliamazoniensis TaxID=1499688 RepID=A0A0U1NVY6_9BACI|nr:transposase IS200-family protein [Neobacillus massiliamazoniensis]
MDAVFFIKSSLLDLVVWYNLTMKSYMKYKSNNNVVYSCKYHVVWCPKYRRNVLVEGVDERLKSILFEVANGVKAEIIELEVMPDHVHLLVEVDPQFGINKLVRHLKGVSSRILRKEFPWLKSRIPSLWTNSYFVSTVGGTTLDVVLFQLNTLPSPISYR